MTDTLPRTIPTDPAEQERLMPEWVKVEVCRLWNSAAKTGGYWQPNMVAKHFHHTFAHALTIWQWMPEPVDPDLLMAREVCAELWPAEGYYLSGSGDSTAEIRAALAAIKRGRALEREAGK